MVLAVRPARLRLAVGLALVLVPAAATAQVSPTADPHPTFSWYGITTPYGQSIRLLYMPPQPVTLEYEVVVPPDSPPPGAPPPSAETPAAPGEAGRPPDTPRGAEGDGDRDAPPPTVRIVRQEVTVPGYYVRETTVGYHYPERWVVEQSGPNAYQWRMLPPQFLRKYP